MEIFKAHQQWATRPADERFSTIGGLYQQTKMYAEHAAEKMVPWRDVRVEDRSGDLVLVGKAGIPAKLTNWAFGQMSQRIGAPASYLRELPATLVAQNLNYGLKNRSDEDSGQANLLFHQNGDLVLRALTTEKYSRLWNWEVAERLQELSYNGWVPATPDFNFDGEATTALYASDHDMFAFLKLDARTITEAGSDQPLHKGIIVGNSEVGASSFFVMGFAYRAMCGNHIIWGAKDVIEMKIRHMGDIRERFASYSAVIKEYADESVSDLEAKIKKSKETLIGATKEEVLDAVFGKRNLNLSRKLISASYDACVEEEDGSPRTPWGLVQGMTRFSQKTPYADERTAIDRGAAKILEAF